MSLQLDSGRPENRTVPKEYNLHVANKQSHNTFVFTEKDMPGYRQFQADGAPMHYLNRKRVEKKRSGIPFRRAVPSRSDLKVGIIRTHSVVRTNCFAGPSPHRTQLSAGRE